GIGVNVTGPAVSVTSTILYMAVAVLVGVIKIVGVDPCFTGPDAVMVPPAAGRALVLIKCDSTKEAVTAGIPATAGGPTTAAVPFGPSMVTLQGVTVHNPVNPSN